MITTITGKQCRTTFILRKKFPVPLCYYGVAPSIESSSYHSIKQNSACWERNMASAWDRSSNSDFLSAATFNCFSRCNVNYSSFTVWESVNFSSAQFNVHFKILSAWLLWWASHTSVRPLSICTLSDVTFQSSQVYSKSCVALAILLLRVPRFYSSVWCGSSISFLYLSQNDLVRMAAFVTYSAAILQISTSACKLSLKERIKFVFFTLKNVSKLHTSCKLWSIDRWLTL